VVDIDATIFVAANKIEQTGLIRRYSDGDVQIVQPGGQPARYRIFNLGRVFLLLIWVSILRICVNALFLCFFSNGFFAI
jgi:hypothetical protein